MRRHVVELMTLIDTHTHLDGFAASGELPAVLARAEAVGVNQMIAIGTATDDWGVYRELARAHAPRVQYTVGLHPCSVEANWAEAVGQIEDFWSGTGPKPVALGECGLDRFHLPKNDPGRAAEIFGWQEAAFRVQLEIVRKLGCPLVVHSRGAFQECVELIGESGVAWERVVFHCFTEGAVEMAELKRRGGYGSFTGVLTYKSAENVRAAARTQGLERLMLETDAPFLTPMPHRGKTNEPALMKHTAEYAAALFGVSLEEIAAVSTRNARAFFGI
jgi:TatD DNase family protein